ncbi:MAG: hypothetical protein F4Z17_11090 [Acidimicrobiia bacterium]|nr:hypothetical protein [Acidimicrobiia bacterium]
MPETGPDTVTETAQMADSTEEASPAGGKLTGPSPAKEGAGSDKASARKGAKAGEKSATDTVPSGTDSGAAKGTVKPKKAPANKPPAKPIRRGEPAKRVRARRRAGSAKSSGGKKKQTSFRVGDKVVHPHHGAAEIIKRAKLDLAGEPRQYFELEIATESSLKVLIPVDTIDETIRPVITKTAAGNVLLKFKEDPQDSGANWSRWYKVLNEKMTSGDIFQVAEVVRDLTHAQQAKGISPALKRMLSKARTTLSSELAFALRITPDQALERIDAALPQPETPEE